MNIFSEAISKGHINIYHDTDPEIIDTVNKYNKHMGSCRVKMKRMEEIVVAHLIMNPLIFAGMIGLSAKTVLHRPLAALIILLLNTIVFIVFSIIKRNLIVSTVSSALLIILDIRFCILTAANFALMLLHENIDRSLKTETGYPYFADILITFKRMDTPKLN